MRVLVRRDQSSMLIGVTFFVLGKAAALEDSVQRGNSQEGAEFRLEVRALQRACRQEAVIILLWHKDVGKGRMQ